jgi:hypothetical protein
MKNLIFCIRFFMSLLTGALCYRVARILGHWEIGLLLFLAMGYLFNTNDNTREISNNTRRKSV